MKLYHNLEQQTPEWFQEKKGVVSGTGLKSIVGTPKARQDYFYEIISQRLMVGVLDQEEPPMARGNRLEPEARAMFQLKIGRRITTVGFAKSLESEFIGYSPDGLVEDEQGTFETEDVEIKCPQGKNYVKAWLTNKVPEEYYAQVIQGFIVNPKLQKRYFVLYFPEIPSHPMHVMEIRRIDVELDIKAYKHQEMLFIAEVDHALKTLITI